MKSVFMLLKTKLFHGTVFGCVTILTTQFYECSGKGFMQCEVHDTWLHCMNP